MTRLRQFPFVFSAYCVFAVAVILLGLLLGSASLSLTLIVQLVTGQADHSLYQIILDLRLPRVLNAFAIGGLLALAGTLMQNLLRNPLADPYILGVSGGSALAVLTAISIGLTGWWLDGSAFAGALVATYLLWLISGKLKAVPETKLILVGVVLAAGFAALIALLLSAQQDQQIRSMLFWLMGDLSFSSDFKLGAITLLLGATLSLSLATQMDVLNLGPLQARTLGVDVDRLRLTLFVLSAALTAVAVSQAGTIGFIGLVAPHIVRLHIGGRHRRLIPCAVVLGGSLLCLADILSRTLMAPKQLPVGAFTALIGVPMFFYILNRKQQQTS